MKGGSARIEIGPERIRNRVDRRGRHAIHGSLGGRKNHAVACTPGAVSGSCLDYHANPKDPGWGRLTEGVSRSRRHGLWMPEFYLRTTHPCKTFRSLTRCVSRSRLLTWQKPLSDLFTVGTSEAHISEVGRSPSPFPRTVPPGAATGGRLRGRYTPARSGTRDRDAGGRRPEHRRCARRGGMGRCYADDGIHPERTERRADGVRAHRGPHPVRL